jgi:hypothetical protein
MNGINGHNIDARTPEEYIMAILYLDMFKVDALSIFIPRTGIALIIGVTRGSPIFMRLDVPTK